MCFRLVSAIAFALLVMPAMSQAATRIDDPAKFVAALYNKVKDASKMSPGDMPEDIYTPRLAALFQLEKKETGGSEDRLDFVFWTNAQDWQLTDIKVTEAPVEDAKDRKIVIAKFKNTGRPEEIHFYFEQTKDGWKLDDARALGGDRDETWTLSLILKYGSDDMAN